MIKTITFTAEEKGPRLLVLGAIHGDEICGPIAISRVIQELENNAISLQRGRITFVPVCNPQAYAKNARFVERNLNRYLVPMDTPDCYEAHLGNILCPLLADCDVLLDLHSYPLGGKPFVFVGPPHPEERAYASSLGVPNLLTGWQEAYAATGRQKTNTNPDESTGTTEYARRFGALAVTLECGDHKDPQAPEVAYRAIHKAMFYLGMTGTKETEIEPTHTPRLVTVTHVFYRNDNGTFTHNWQHLDSASEGTTLAVRENGEKILAPYNGLIVLPHSDAPLKAEWFYFAKESSLESAA